MLYLFDTSALLAHFRCEPGWGQVQAVFDDSAAEILISSVSLTELARRLRELGCSDMEAHKTVSDYALLVRDVVAVDERIAYAAFEVACATPKRLPLVDALIAACARERNACLVHRDAHMASIPANVLQQLMLTTELDTSE